MSAKESTPRKGVIKPHESTPVLGTASLSDAPRRRSSVQWSMDTNQPPPSLPGGANSLSRPKLSPRVAQWSNAGAEFRQNMMDFFYNVYGSEPLAEHRLDAHPPGLRMGAVPTASPILPPLSAKPTAGQPLRERPQLVKPWTANGAEKRDFSLTSAANGVGTRHDQFDTLLDSIIQGYKQRSAMGKPSAGKSGEQSFSLGSDHISEYVSHALDNFLAKEASFSMKGSDLASARSFLSAGGDCIFTHLLSFQAQSQMSLNDFCDEPSETAVAPAFGGQLAMFRSVKPNEPPSVSKSSELKLGALPPASLPSISSPRRTNAPSPRSRGGETDRSVGVIGGLFPRGLSPPVSTSMSLDSAIVQKKPSDSWVGTDGGGTKKATSTTRVPLTETIHANAETNKTVATIRAITPTSNGASHAEAEAVMAQLIREEELKRSVIMAIERRFRLYLSSFFREEIPQRSPQNSKSAKVPKPPLNSKVPTPAPMVQNLLDFFGEKT